MQKTGQFRPPTQKSSQSIPTLETSHFRPSYENQVNFHHPQKKQVNQSPHWNKSFSARTQKPSQFWPPNKKHVNFDPTLNPSQLRSATQKPSWARPQHWFEVNFNLHYKSKSFSMPPDTKTKLILSRLYLNQVIYDPRTKPIHFRSIHWNQVNSDPPHWNPVYFDYPHNNHFNFDVNTKTMSFSASAILSVIHTGTCSGDTAAIRIT